LSYLGGCLRNMKSYFYFFLILLVTGINLQSKCSVNEVSVVQIPTDTINKDTLINITISSVGDLMCHSTQYNYARVDADSFNFVPCFEYVQSWLNKPDLMLGNLETTFAGNNIPYSGYPYFNSPDDYITSLKKVGFDFLVTANNHANDTGEKGILRTIEKLDEEGFNHTGTYSSQKDRDSIRIVNVEGIKIAILSYTYSTNGLLLTEGKPWLVNYCDSALIQKDIKQSRISGAELVLVFYHFGNEYERLPGAYQKDLVKFAIECGADIILGSHVHVLQPLDFFVTQNATLDTGFVIYSMGNFISNQQDQYTNEGIIVNIHLEKNINSNKIKITEVDYVPTWVYKGKNEAKKLHMVFPVMPGAESAFPEFIITNFDQDIKNAYKNTTGTMEKYTNKVLPVTQ